MWGRLICLVAVLLLALPVDAHKGITSKYNYNEDVFPILNQRCGKCHVAGGVAPMSLLSGTSPSGLMPAHAR